MALTKKIQKDSLTLTRQLQANLRKEIVREFYYKVNTKSKKLCRIKLKATTKRAETTTAKTTLII